MASASRQNNLLEPPPSTPFRPAWNEPPSHPLFNQRYTTTLHGDRSFRFPGPRSYEWDPYVEQSITRLYRNVLQTDPETGDLFLPAGTRLYHGSIVPNLDLTGKHASGYMTYFGLDAAISIWYVLELSLKYKQSEPGYLYTFELTKPLPVHLIRRLTDHPENHWGGYCNDPEIVCIHPQLAYHHLNSMRMDELNKPYELSVEVTIHTAHYKDYLRLLSVEQVDPTVLEAHANRAMNEWHPRHAVTELGSATAAAQTTVEAIELKNIHRRGGRGGRGCRGRRGSKSRDRSRTRSRNTLKRKCPSH